MSDEHDPSNGHIDKMPAKDDTEPGAAELARHMEAVMLLRNLLQTNIGLAADEFAAATGAPVDPDVLAGALLTQVGTIAIRWGQARRVRPAFIEDYFEKLMHRAKRGFRAQLNHAINHPPSQGENN